MADAKPNVPQTPVNDEAAPQKNFIIAPHKKSKAGNPCYLI